MTRTDVRRESRETSRRTFFLGVDLAWGAGSSARAANETGLVLLADDGTVLEAGWTRGPGETVAWIEAHVPAENVVAFIDAPLLVTNPSGQRECETQVGQRYGRWKVSANSSNLGSANAAGVTMRRLLEDRGWSYDDGLDGPGGTSRRRFSECYPYTTLVGVPELGYDTERPRYKRPPRRLPAATWQPRRAAACDDLLRRLERLTAFDPPLDLASHPVTRRLLDEPSPLNSASYKHREDLIDAAICAWTAAYWTRHGTERSQVLGPQRVGAEPSGTIIAPARSEQRSSDRRRGGVALHPGS